MTEPTPNDQQGRLIDTTEGTVLVDAGAGTGKTFAVTRRYAEIIDQPGVEPDDVLLVTFTTNAATEMTERIVDRSNYSVRDLADAPIQTFHSFCHDLLQDFGHDAPRHLGIDDRITGSTRVVEEEIVERSLFREFINGFSDRHPEYEDFFRVLSARLDLLSLINELAAKGVFPTAEGWYRDGERHLSGDYETFKRLFDDANQPRNGGRKQSELRSALSGFGRDECYLPDAPEAAEIRGGGTKRVPDETARRAFEEDREALQSFVHDVYFEYLEFALSRNYLNFGFLQLFAFVLLCEDDALREEIAFEYVTVDEFQDTSEIQFKLTLLLAGTDNVCVVGDWKQSIFSFQYADVENITAFEERLERFAADLNRDRQRVDLDTTVDHRIEFERNYRSTQTILDFSETTLTTPATSNDDVSPADLHAPVDPLTATTEHDPTRIEAIQHEDEHEAVLTKIQEIVGNDDYLIEDDGELREPEYGDVAVFSRTRDFGRELLQAAQAHDFPMAYEGGIELFRTDQAKLLLAWLRILERNADRGWAAVLERAGYALDEIDHMLETEEHPENIRQFRDELAALETVGGVAERVFARYGYDGSYADAVLTTIQSMHDASTLTRGDLIRAIERGIESGATREVQTDAGTNSVTVQTIHAAKGLEYPIVILANMNEYRFPPRGGGSPEIVYEEPVGLRQRTLYSDVHGAPHLYDNWRYDVLRRCLPDGYDEERRLLYVAATRAESHLLFSCGERPNSFIEELDVEIEEYSPDVSDATVAATEQATLEVSIPSPEGPIGHTPHTIMDDAVFEDVDEGRGTAFGTAVHEFAERYALGDDVDPSNPDQETVKEFLDTCSGDLIVEEEAYLPVTVDGEQITVSGLVDLVHVRPDVVSIVDYKTDLGRHAESEYRKQLSVYYHVARAAYPDRTVRASILYTHSGELVSIDPLSMDALAEVIGGSERRHEPTDRQID